jgi:hypothetical protein
MPKGKPNILVIWGDDIGFVESMTEFPPVQLPNTFTVDDALRKMREGALAGAS